MTASYAGVTVRKSESGIAATPTVQVIERMFALMDVLASREEAISLKEISENSIMMNFKGNYKEAKGK